MILRDPENRANLLPLVYTRPVADLRIGITTIAEKWAAMTGREVGIEVGAEYLTVKYPHPAVSDDRLVVMANILPTRELIEAITHLHPVEALRTPQGRLIAYHTAPEVDVVYEGEVTAIDFPYDIFLNNGTAIRADFERITALRESQPLSATNTLIGPAEMLFIEEGASVEGAVINTTGGPVYIGRGATIMEGACVRGPLALCEHGTITMGARVYGDTTIGPWCKVGGEVNNVVFHSYSNKAHDGFLGNAVIGQWCNMGAGSTASNLKNDYTPIRLWNYPTHRFLHTGLQFCGLIMGDHSKAGINTMFNTATVLGVGVNVYGSGFPRNFVASFQEGSAAGFTEVSMSRFFDTARRMMARRNIELSDADEAILTAIRNLSEQYK